jgi:hypothetical protein
MRTGQPFGILSQLTRVEEESGCYPAQSDNQRRGQA